MKLRFTSLRASVRPFVAAAAMTSMIATGCAPVEDNVDSTNQLVTYSLATTTDTDVPWSPSGRGGTGGRRDRPGNSRAITRRSAAP